MLWCRISPQNTSVWSASSTFANSVHPAEKAFLPLETGGYSFCPPSTDLADFWDYTSNSTYTETIPIVRLDNSSLVNVFWATDPDGLTSLAVNMDWHVEFRTSSTLFDIALCNAPIESLHSAQLAVVKSGFFFDNFDHVAIINGIIRTLSSFHPLFNVMAPVAAGILKGSSRATTTLSRKTRPPRASSAQRNGMVGRARSTTAGSASVAGSTSSRIRAWNRGVRRPGRRTATIASSVAGSTRRGRARRGRQP